MAEKTKLNHDQMLQAEFNYIANTAFQANEDRSRVTSFYFVTAGSLVAAILGAQFSETQTRGISLAFMLLFAVLTALGALTIAQLARLRSAWHDSVHAMNKIKEFYIENNPEIAAAFQWRARQVPPTDKPYSIANLMAIQVALLGGLTTGAMTYYLMNVLTPVNGLGWSMVIIACGVGYLSLWKWYKHLLMQD